MEEQLPLKTNAPFSDGIALNPHMNLGDTFCHKAPWQLTPVLLPGESHGQWSLTGYGQESRGSKKSNTKQQLSTHLMSYHKQHSKIALQSKWVVCVQQEKTERKSVP